MAMGKRQDSTVSACLHEHRRSPRHAPIPNLSWISPPDIDSEVRAKTPLCPDQALMPLSAAAEGAIHNLRVQPSSPNPHGLTSTRAKCEK